MISVKKLTKLYRSQVKTGNIYKDFFHPVYKNQKALDDISFEIEQGELIGFIGPNGAGKTTTMKILSGILYPSHGEIQVLKFTPWEKKSAFLKQIGFVMGQKNQLLWDLPATDSFRLNKEIYEIPENVYKKNVDELITLLECKDFIHQQVKTLSLGQRMRVELIASLLHNPKILFLDEPTIGLDIFAQQIIVNFIKQYQEEKKATIILTSHYMQDVQRLAKRILFINKGTIIYDGTLEKLLSTYSTDKTIELTLSTPISKEVQKQFSIQTEDYTFPKLRLCVKKEQLSDVLSRLLPNVEFNDLSIEEESLEDVIKKMYQEK
ncbi:ATP-binding cassette domain-containing protein [Candidatus Roizmanbacteria bacterium]|nr:ATP-binding cassette domain-containing protein [Candidatus Roizmanbacteria bacterium]